MRVCASSSTDLALEPSVLFENNEAAFSIPDEDVNEAFRIACLSFPIALNVNPLPSSPVAPIFMFALVVTVRLVAKWEERESTNHYVGKINDETMPVMFSLQAGAGVDIFDRLHLNAAFKPAG